MVGLTVPGRDDALRIMSEVSQSDSIHAGILSPMAGTRRVRLSSLSSVESFLKPSDADTIFASGVRASIRYVDLSTLGSWIDTTLGDPELALAIGGLAASGRPYGALVPEVKELIAQRVGQCRQVLGDDPEAAS